MKATHVCQHGNGIKVWYAREFGLKRHQINTQCLSVTHFLGIGLSSLQFQGIDPLDFLEDIFGDLNAGSPTEWSEANHLRSMVVGDVVELWDGRLYYCDKSGWVLIGYV